LDLDFSAPGWLSWGSAGAEPRTPARQGEGDRQAFPQGLGRNWCSPAAFDTTPAAKLQWRAARLSDAKTTCRLKAKRNGRKPGFGFWAWPAKAASGPHPALPFLPWRWNGWPGVAGPRPGITEQLVGCRTTSTCNRPARARIWIRGWTGIGFPTTPIVIGTPFGLARNPA